MKCVIAIDGPAASGKSTIAAKLAQKLGFLCVNSGNFYRAITWHLLANTCPLNAKDIKAVLEKIDLTTRTVDNKIEVLINRKNPGDFLYGDVVNSKVSLVASMEPVRTFLLQRLRGLADTSDLIMEGRDIGSVVFPDAPYKFYLDASQEIRRQRRQAQGIIDEIPARDTADASRSLAPLKIAEDAVTIDTSAMDIEEVVSTLLHHLDPLLSRKARHS